MSDDAARHANRGWFRKGQSGNPGGRPKGTLKNRVSAFDVVVSRNLTVTRNGVTREVTLDEALQQRTYQEALAGKRMAVREVLRWIVKREEWLSKHRPPPVQPITFQGTIADPDNADEALVLLKIARDDPKRQGLDRDRRQLLLEAWAVEAALKRRRGAKPLTKAEIDDIRRTTFASDTLKLPEGRDR